MELFAVAAAALVVLGAPGLASIYWLRSRDASADAVEIAAVGYGGLAVSALALWLSSQLFGSSWRVVLLASLGGSVAVITPALIRAALRAAGSEALGAADAIAYTGQHDGRVVPEAFVDPGTLSVTAEIPANKRHFAILAAAGTIFAGLAYLPFLSYGMERADGIHRMAMTDWYKHLMTTTALGAADVFPPPNPFVHAVDAAPYYYGFHLIASSIARTAGAVAGAAGPDLVYTSLLLLTLLTALATPFVAYTVARTIAAGKGAGLGDASSVPLVAALGATFLAGFDLVPLTIDTAVNLATSPSTQRGLAWLRDVIPSTNLDYWIHHNERQLNAPYTTLVWAPQHLAAVLVALLVIHLVLRRGHLAERTWRLAPFGVAWLLPATMLAALPALSAYVALGLATGVAGAAIVESLRERTLLWGTLSWRLWLVPGAAATVLALPVVAVLGSGPGPGIVVQVSAAGRWVNGAIWSSWFGEHWFAKLLDTPAVLLVELGVIGVLGVLEIRGRSSRKRTQPHQAHVVALLATIVVLVTVFRPPVGGPNNLYARPMLLVWFLLAPFAAMRFVRATGLVTRAGGMGDGDHAVLSRARRLPGARNARWVLAATALCLLGSGYALVGVVLEGGLFWATPTPTVDALQWIERNAPPDAVVAIHPDDFRGQMGYWARRPLALADERHALLFGAEAADYEAASAALRAAFASVSPEDAARSFDAIGASLALVPIESAALIRWLGPTCWEIAYDNADWLIVRRAYDGCPQGGS